MAKIDDIRGKLHEMWDSNGFVNRRTRMESDYGLYSLQPFDAGEGYQSYTSNTPRVTADKIISWLNDSKMIVSSPLSAKHDERESGSVKEKFIVGALNLADDRMTARGMLTVKSQIAAYICLRGWFAGRAILNKRKGKTFVDVTPFDPARVVFDSDDDGIIWLAQRTLRSSHTIKQLYNVDVNEPTQDEYDDEFGIPVWDYYDREQHAVLIDGTGPKWGKKPLPHDVKNLEEEGIAPVFVGPVGIVPWIQGISQDPDIASDYGESVFAANREIYEDYNFTMSAMKTLVRRSVRQGYILQSPDGTQTLDDDPWRDGSEVPLPQGTEIKPLPEIKMPVDTGAFQALVSGEIQRGSLSNVHMGEMPFAISGYAANVVREGSSHQLEPRLKALESAFAQIGEILTSQFVTSRFGTMEVSGRLNDLTDQFHEEIRPEDAKDGGRIRIRFKPQSNLEDPQKIATAQMLREGDNPLAPDDWIWENVLDVSDTEQFKDAIKAQMGNRGDPKAQLMNMVQGLLKTGERDKALVYVELLLRTVRREKMMEQMEQMQFMQAAGQMMQPPAPPGEAAQPGMPPAPPGMPPVPGGAGTAPPVSLGVQAGAIPQAQFTGPTGVPPQAGPGEPGGPAIDQVLSAMGLGVEGSQ